MFWFLQFFCEISKHHMFAKLCGHGITFVRTRHWKCLKRLKKNTLEKNGNPLTPTNLLFKMFNGRFLKHGTGLSSQRTELLVPSYIHGAPRGTESNSLGVGDIAGGQLGGLENHQRKQGKKAQTKLHQKIGGIKNPNLILNHWFKETKKNNQKVEVAQTFN